MDERLLRQLVRQLKLLNFWISVVGTLLLASLIAIGILLYKVVTVARNASNQVKDLKQTTAQKLDVESQACTSNTLGAFLRQNTDVCQKDQ